MGDLAVLALRLLYEPFFSMRSYERILNWGVPWGVNTPLDQILIRPASKVCRAAEGLST